MNTDNLKIIIQDLQRAISALEAEVYSDASRYINTDTSYEDVLEYYQNPANGEEGL